VPRPGRCGDNLKTGVDRPDLYDPQLNRSFGELAEHYGVLASGAPVGFPERALGEPARCG